MAISIKKSSFNFTLLRLHFNTNANIENNNQDVSQINIDSSHDERGDSMYIDYEEKRDTLEFMHHKSEGT